MRTLRIGKKNVLQKTRIGQTGQRNRHLKTLMKSLECSLAVLQGDCLVQVAQLLVRYLVRLLNPQAKVVG
jgi:hypothetical protein